MTSLTWPGSWCVNTKYVIQIYIHSYGPTSTQFWRNIFIWEMRSLLKETNNGLLEKFQCSVPVIMVWKCISPRKRTPLTLTACCPCPRTPPLPSHSVLWGVWQPDQTWVDRMLCKYLPCPLPSLSRISMKMIRPTLWIVVAMPQPPHGHSGHWHYDWVSWHI